MIGLLVMLLCYFIMIIFKKKKYYHLIDELDYLKYELSNKTVPFELAKLRSTKKSEHIVSLVQKWEKRWEELEAQFVTVTENIIYGEELVSQRNFSVIDGLIADIKADLEFLNQQINELSGEIQMLKKTEERGRSNVLELRGKCEELKLQYENDKNKYLEVKKEIQSIFADIETGFSTFNDYMEECNYDLADETIDLIKTKMEILTNLIEKVPLYQENINQELRPLLNEVLSSYENISESGVYLQHLEIKETIEIYQEQLNNVMNWIRNFEFKKFEMYLIEVHENAKQMIEYMKKEVGFQETFQSDLELLKKEVDLIQEEGKALSERYENIKINCTLSSEDEENFNLLLNEIQIVSNEKEFLINKIAENKTASSTLHREVGYILNQVEQIKEQLGIFDREVENLYSGEKECRQRALDLLKSFNELKGRYQQLILPVNNEQLHQKITQGNHALQLLFEVIGRVPINIFDITEQLENTNETIEEISRHLESEMEQVLLAEELIVYGHRYAGLEGMYLVDLTIAEDQFRQGCYQNAIEKMQELLKGIEGDQFNLAFP